MNSAVVPATEQGEIREGGGTPLGPVTDVMALPEADPAAREPAAAVSVMERPPERRRDRAGPGTDFHNAAVPAVLHHHPTRVARQALRRFRGNVGAVLEDRLAGLVGIREERGIDMNHHLISLCRGAGLDAVVESCLREQRQRVGLLLRHGRRFRGNVRRPGVPVLRACPLIQRLASRGQRLHEHGADLGRQPPSESHHAVLVLIHVQRAARVPPGGLDRLGLAVRPAPAAHDAFDVIGRACTSHGEQTLFGRRRRHTG